MSRRITVVLEVKGTVSAESVLGWLADALAEELAHGYDVNEVEIMAADEDGRRIDVEDL